MAKESKRLRELRKDAPADQLELAAAIARVKGAATAKFDESIEVAVRLGVDPRKSDQAVRGVVAMPAGTGKEVKVAVLCQADKQDAAKEAGADIVGFEDLLEKIGKGELGFDVLIAEPTVMPKLGKHGKVLGPKGLMPNPKQGTVMADVAKAVKQAKAGQVTYRTEKAGIVHAAIGRASFAEADLESNFHALMRALKQSKPAAAKGQYLVSASLSSSMGPAVQVDVAPLR